MSKGNNGSPSSPPVAEISRPLEEQKRKLQELSTPPDPNYFEGTIFEGGSFRKQLEEFKEEPRRALFGEFWKERELAILAGQTGVGKSALALQIALKVSEGTALDSLKGDGTEVETPAQKVLFLDCENSVETWKGRVDERTVPPSLLRFNIKLGAEFEGSYSKEIVRSASVLLERTGAKVLIIDNVSWLFSDLSQNDLHAETSALMKLLWQLKTERSCAILVIAHTLKGKGASTFEIGDVQGSTNLTKYLESLFAVARVHGHESQRYLKQLKTRNRKERFGESNVAVCDLVQIGKSLQYVRREELDSREKLLLSRELDKKEEIESLLIEGKSAKEIVEELEVSRSYVHKVKKELNLTKGVE